MTVISRMCYLPSYKLGACKSNKHAQHIVNKQYLHCDTYTAIVHYPIISTQCTCDQYVGIEVGYPT
ncbi:MAG: hypothetical protein ACKPKO_45495, partial [Candidatus Fonsibacter sp.]